MFISNVVIIQDRLCLVWNQTAVCEMRDDIKYSYVPFIYTIIVHNKIVETSDSNTVIFPERCVDEHAPAVPSHASSRDGGGGRGVGAAVRGAGAPRGRSGGPADAGGARRAAARPSAATARHRTRRAPPQADLLAVPLVFTLYR